jgi:hypothetical protein
MSREGMPRLCRRCGRQLRVNHARDSWHCRECVNHARKPALATSGFEPACHDPQHDPEWWWPETVNDSCIPVAIAICFQCPLVDKCLAYALNAKEREGIWGGTTPAERRQLMAQGKAS